jgi:hypothetical protein
LLEFDSDGARFLFDLASAAGAERADRTVAAWGRSRPAPRPRDEAYQRGYPSPQGRADRPLDKGPHGGPCRRRHLRTEHVPQDRELNRGWSVEGRRYRALEREIANTPGTFFFCCLLYADDTDFPAAVELGCFVAMGCKLSGSVTASTSKDGLVGVSCFSQRGLPPVGRTPWLCGQG